MNVFVLKPRCYFARSSAFLFIVVLFAAAPIEAAAQRAISADIGVELRGFLSEPRHEDQERHGASVSLELDFFREAWDRRLLLVATPFGRLDAGDSRRTRVDLREAYVQYIGNQVEFKVGFTKVFWGVTESNHLVDIINQTDGIESTDGEAKLGQPMVQASWIFNQGVLDLYFMPFFRERTFPGKGGRLRSPWVIEVDNTLKQERIDLGARLYLPIRSLDLGISGFRGTSREPLLMFDPMSASPSTAYPIITQLGLDVQYIYGAWLLKSEALFRSGYLSDYVATSTGFEYTFSNVRFTGWDIGLLAEYHYDGRDTIEFGGQSFNTTPLNHDVFGGIRWALNDVQDSQFLGGAITDTDSGETAFFVEASRRIGSRVSADLEVRSVNFTTPDGPLHFVRDDSYVQLSVTYFY